MNNVFFMKNDLIDCKMQKAFSFLDYVRGGTELACTISIDFTASNGNPQSQDSLHYIHSRGKLKKISRQA